MNVHALELACIEVCESYRYCTWYEITGRPCLMLDPRTEIPNILCRKVLCLGDCMGIVLLMEGYCNGIITH